MYVISLIVKNEFGVMQRVMGEFTRNKINVETIVVGKCEQQGKSRMVLSVIDENEAKLAIGRLQKLQDVYDTELVPESGQSAYALISTSNGNVGVVGGSDQVEEIIAKAQSGDYEALLRELQVYGVPDGYYRLLGEVAELLNTTVSFLQSRPDEVQLLLCKFYVDLWLCDKATLQRELDRVISVNGRTLSDIHEHEKIKDKAKTPAVPVQSAADTVPTLSELFDDYNRRNGHSHFSREKHQHLSEIARRRQQSEQERIIQTEERERKFRP